jgi:PAS domain S-box-containing protein
MERRDIPSEVQEVIKKELSEFKKTKARLEYLLKSGPAIIYACEPWGDYRTTFMSENVRDILGHDPEKFLYNHSFWVDGIHTEDRKRVTETFSLIFERNFFSDVYRFQQKDGTYRWMLEEANLIRDEQGNPLEIVGYWTDVTLQKEAEEQLRNERENLYKILNSTDDVIYIVNLHYELEFTNAATEKEFGPVEGKKCYEYFNKISEACSWCTLEEVINGETIRREKYLSRNQKTYDMIDTPFKNLDGSISSLAILRDISERKKAEEAMQESEEKYRSFVENFQGIAFKGYEDFSAGFFLGKVEEITGYAEDDFISGEIVYNQLIHPEDIQWVNDEVEKFTASSRRVTRREYRIIDKKGNLHWIQESIQKFYDAEKRMEGVYGNLQDITDRIKAEEEIKKFKAITDSAGYGVGMIDMQGTLSYVNEAFAKMHGYTEDEIIGKHFSILHTKEQMKNVNRLVDLLAQKGSYIVEEVWHKRKDNTVFPTSMNRTLISNEKGKPQFIAATAIDITKRKQAEMAMRESEEKFRLLSEQSILGIVILQDNLIKYVNNACAEIIEYSPKEMLDWTQDEFVKAVHPEDRQVAIEQARKKQLGESGAIAHYSFRLISKTGKVKWIDNYSKTILYEGKTANFSTLTDITERINAEEALRENEEKFRTMAERTSDWIWEVDTNGIYTYASPKSKDILGYEPEEVIGKTPFDLMPPEEADRVEKLFRNITKSQEPFERLENINLHKNGQHVVLETSGVPIFGAEGKLLGYRGIDRDITDRKQAEKALQESEVKYRNLVEQANDGIAIVKDNKIVLVNQKLALMLGYTIEELLNTDYIRVFHPDVILMIKERYQARIACEDVPSIFESKLKKKDGSALDIELNIGLIDYQEDTTATLSFIRDITERKQAEDQLQHQANLLKNVSDAVISSDLDFRITSWNKAAERIYGWQESEVLERGIVEVTHLEYPYDKMEDVIESFMKEGVWRGEVTQRRKDGTPINIITSATLVNDRTGKPIAALAVNRDITKRKKIEEALKKSEEKYRLLFESAPIGIGMVDLKGNVLDGNQRMLDATGYSLDEFKTISLSDTYVNPKDRNKLFETLQESGYVRDFEVYLKRKDGTPYYSLLDVIFMELGGQYVLLITLRDLTEWREMDRARRESEERLLKFMESATDGFTLLDSNLNFIDMNKSGLKGLGLTKEQILGKNYLDIFPDAMESGNYEKCLEVIRTGKPSYIDTPGVRQKHFSVRIFKVGEGLGAISTDITDRMKTEKTREELEQKRDNFVWMTSHELRTPLTVLTGYCDFLIKHIKDLAQKRIKNILSVMKNNLDRLELLASEVSTIGQIERGIFEVEKISMSLCDFLQDTIEPYYQLLGNQFEFQGCLDDTPVIIDGDAHRLQQVLDNIISNAIKQTDKDLRKILVTSKISPKDIVIEVSDNGAGIESENLEVIFDQFVSFPTEFSTTGTGIGLYLSQKILEEHGGRIKAQSKGLGRGATFTIELPRNKGINL